MACTIITLHMSWMTTKSSNAWCALWCMDILYHGNWIDMFEHLPQAQATTPFANRTSDVLTFWLPHLVTRTLLPSYDKSMAICFSAQLHLFPSFPACHAVWLPPIKTPILSTCPLQEGEAVWWPAQSKSYIHSEWLPRAPVHLQRMFCTMATESIPFSLGDVATLVVSTLSASNVASVDWASVIPRVQLTHTVKGYVIQPFDTWWWHISHYLSEDEQLSWLMVIHAVAHLYWDGNQRHSKAFIHMSFNDLNLNWCWLGLWKPHESGSGWISVIFCSFHVVYCSIDIQRSTSFFINQAYLQDNIYTPWRCLIWH